MKSEKIQFEITICVYQDLNDVEWNKGPMMHLEWYLPVAHIDPCGNHP